MQRNRTMLRKLINQKFGSVQGFRLATGIHQSVISKYIYQPDEFINHPIQQDILNVWFKYAENTDPIPNGGQLPMTEEIGQAVKIMMKLVYGSMKNYVEKHPDEWGYSTLNQTVNFRGKYRENVTPRLARLMEHLVDVGYDKGLEDEPARLTLIQAIKQYAERQVRKNE